MDNLADTASSVLVNTQCSSCICELYCELCCEEEDYKLCCDGVQQLRQSSERNSGLSKQLLVVVRQCLEALPDTAAR